jgi:hypothetical protein
MGFLVSRLSQAAGRHIASWPPSPRVAPSLALLHLRYPLHSCMLVLQIDSVSSKVGRAVGQQAWDELGAHVRLSVHWSLTIGVAAAPLLLAARTPMCSWLLALSSEVQQELSAFWILRSLLVPFQLCSMAAAGVLQVCGCLAPAHLPAQLHAKHHVLAPPLYRPSLTLSFK